MGFIDDLSKNITQGISDIQCKSQEVMASISLNNRMNSLEGKKTAALVNLGQLVYDKYERGDEVSDSLLKSKTKEIVEIENEIKLLRVELEGLRPEPDAPRSQKAAHMAGYRPTPGFQCPHCQAPAASNKHFCVSCGGSLKEAQESHAHSGNGDSGEEPSDSN